MTLLPLAVTASAMSAAAPLTPEIAERFANLALACVHREYPNKIAHVLQSDRDARPPRRLTPAFFGCFDWHSAVHGHWMLVRLARALPDAPFAARARKAVAKSLTQAKIAAEVKYLEARGRDSFERPYGLAWLLQLSAELHEWDDPEAKRWARTLEPLEAAAAKRLGAWLPKLSHPVRTGEHSQTAFALGLVLDWARIRGDAAMESLVVERARTYFQKDVACPLAYEPSGEDFLSPCLAEADLLRRVLEPRAYADWLGAFLPARDPFLRPAIVTDRTDGKLVHLDGLNLSRAWMLDGIASALPADDVRRGVLARAGAEHAASGLASVTGEHYEGGHWLASFATYLVTRRGLSSLSSAAPPP